MSDAGDEEHDRNRDLGGDQDLLDRIETLENRLESIEMQSVPSRRGPFGIQIPRPPSVREVLRFTDDHVLPTAITFLELNIRVLETLRASIRLLDAERDLHSRRASTEDRLERVQRSTLQRLDASLTELQQAIRNGSLPQNAEARAIVADAREIQTAIRDRLESELDTPDTSAPDGASDDEGTADSTDRDAPSEASAVDIDVDEELESIKQAVRDRSADSEDGRSDPDSSDAVDNHNDNNSENENENENDAGDGSSGTSDQ